MTIRCIVLIWMCLWVGCPTLAVGDAYTGTALQRELNAAIDQARKGLFTLEVREQDGNPISGATVHLRQTNHEFMFGGALFTPYFDYSSQEAEKRALQQLADKWFNAVVDGNGFKWPSIEKSPGKIQAGFERHNRITQWAKDHGKAMRHHTLFWSNAKKNSAWVKSLGASDLEEAMFNRIQYTREMAGQDIISLDVINEMLYYSYFRDKLGTSIVPKIYRECKQAFPQARLYINEFPPQQGNDFTVFDRYVDFIKALKAHQVPFDGVGLQAHWDVYGLADAGFTMESFIRQMSQAIDRIAQEAGMPVLITEYDGACRDEHLRAEFLEAFYSMAYANPNVEGILAWEWVDRGHDRALVNQDLSLTLAGKRYEELVLERWMSDIQITLDTTGNARASLFFGTYEVSVNKGGVEHGTQVVLGKDSPRQMVINLD